MNIDNEKLNVILSRIGDIGLRQRVNYIVGKIPLEKNIKVLDLGCGEGIYSYSLSNLGFVGEIVAFDFNAALLEKAGYWIRSGAKVKFINGDITKKLPFESEYFDVIIYTEVMEHLEDDITPLSEINRVLKPTGKLFLTVPNQNFPVFWDPINKIRMGLKCGHFSPFNTILGGVWSYDHKRLYGFKELENKLHKANLNFSEKVLLTHYCLPFNYLILRIGKIVAEKFPGSSYAESIQKFDDGTVKKNKNITFKLTKFIFKIINLQYQKNLLTQNKLNKSSVSIGGIVEKKI